MMWIVTSPRSILTFQKVKVDFLQFERTSLQKTRRHRCWKEHYTAESISHTVESILHTTAESISHIGESILQTTVDSISHTVESNNLQLRHYSKLQRLRDRLAQKLPRRQLSQFSMVDITS